MDNEKDKFWRQQEYHRQTTESFKKRKSFDAGRIGSKDADFRYHIDQQMISKIERNARIVTDYELACFCKALKVTIDEMLQDFNNER